QPRWENDPGRLGAALELLTAFLVTADVPEIYMQEFWATATVHHHSIRFKMDNKKHIVNLKSFREMLHICPRLPHQPFVEPPFEEEILAFLWFFRHSGVIRKLTDVNINKLHQPWRSFTTIINKCLTRKSSGYDSLQLSQAQILYKEELRDVLSSVHEGYHPPLHVKEYFFSKEEQGVTPPKPKASFRKTRSSFDTNITPPTATAGPRLTTSEKGKQAAKASKAKSLSALSKVAMTEAQQLKLVTKWWRRVVGSSGLWWNGQEKTWSGVAGTFSVNPCGCVSFKERQDQPLNHICVMAPMVLVYYIFESVAELALELQFR
nr:hypothetical protein [Tanacetum cinerariifolium]